MAGPSLESIQSVAAARPLKLGEALGVLHDVATALGELHAAGGVHGAVCAENIVIDDQGAARLCKDTPVPPRGSPEQRAGQSPDARSDEYGLGAAVVGLLADAGPLPDPVERMLAKMTAEEPAARYGSMGEVLLALEACELMTGFRAFRPGREAEAMRRRRRGLYVMVLVLGALMLGMALLVALGPTPKSQGEPPATYDKLLEKMVPLPAKPTTATTK